ncbi:MAG: YibE/F family protein [Ruminococcaceae bacterium]|nr:YibE/F family protein [Oscillospiraceae bacterium]
MRSASFHRTLTSGRFVAMFSEGGMALKQKKKAAALRLDWGALAVLFAAALLFAGARLLVRPEASGGAASEGDYVEYENGRVREILSDSTERDAASDGGWRGEQLLLVEVKTGQYAGETLMVSNYVGPLYGVPLRVGDGCTMTVSTYSDGTHRASVYEYDRAWAVIAVVAAFLLVTLLVGGRTGAKSLLGLAFTVLCVLLLLFPALLKGAPTLPTTFLLCAYVAAVSFVLLGGVRKKTVCALLGTVAGMALALGFALAAQALLRVNGLRSADVEPLLQLRQTGTPLRLTGLLAAGVVISSLGAVMDVAMSLSSAMAEVRAADPSMDRRALFRSGMNVGRDMVGTMTNTLILAFLGSGLVLILYIYTLSPDVHQLASSAYLALETISGVSSSIGVVLSVPITAAICAFAYTREK